MKTAISLSPLLLLVMSLTGALSPENETKRREAHLEQMEEQKAAAKTVVTGEVVRVKSKDGPGLFKSRSKGWTNKVVLQVRLIEVHRAEPPLEVGTMVKIRYSIHHPEYGWVGPKRYDPPIPRKGALRKIYLSHGEDRDYYLAAGDQSFDFVESPSSQNHSGGDSG